MSYAWGADSLEPEDMPDPRTFTRERPPARRTTDAAMAGVAVGMTTTVAAIVVRAADRGDWIGVLVFGIAGLMLAVPTVVLCWIVLAWRVERRRGSERAAAEAAAHVQPVQVGLSPDIPGRCCAAGIRAYPEPCPWHPFPPEAMGPIG